jgi:hypothetical protein
MRSAAESTRSLTRQALGPVDLEKGNPSLQFEHPALHGTMSKPAMLVLFMLQS